MEKQCRLKKTFVCYKSKMTESEKEWRKTSMTPLETEDKNEALSEGEEMFNDDSNSKEIVCSMCKIVIRAHKSTIQIKCWKCRKVVCFSCNVSFCLKYKSLLKCDNQILFCVCVGHS